MTVKKIDTGDIAEMVDKANLFAEKVEYLFHRVYGCEENDKVVCLAEDVIGHFHKEINDLWEKIRTAPEADEDYGRKFWDYVAKDALGPCPWINSGRKRGAFMGSIYKRGKAYWIQYYRNGKPYRETTKSQKEADAKRLLKKREGEISDGKFPGIYFDRVKFDELAEGFLRDYRINKRKSVVRAERSTGHLKRYFEGYRVPDITSPKIEAYIESRLEEGASNATINRELSALKRMLILGARQTPPKVDRVPYIPMLKENNVRKGFFEHAEFVALRAELPDHLKGFVTFAYKTGWRLSEITDLTWNQVDRDNGIVRLETGDTKNDEGRTVYLDDELKEVFNHQWKVRKNLLPYVFLNAKGTDKVKRFDKSWKTACKDAKIGKRLFHDFRRTAVRNMIRSGIPERVAMIISGHKTRSVFERYNIVNDRDLQLAAQRQAVYLESQTDTISSTVHDLKQKEANQSVS